MKKKAQKKMSLNRESLLILTPQEIRTAIVAATGTTTAGQCTGEICDTIPSCDFKYCEAPLTA